jgi:hypothetical protein
MNFFTRHGRALLLMAVLAVGAVCVSMVNCTPTPNTYRHEESTAPFPRTGLWKVTGYDYADTYWQANIVVAEVADVNFVGYFDWYSGSTEDYRGREHFTGRFDRSVNKVFFKGTRLENATNNLALSEYSASVGKNGSVFYDGKWGGDNFFLPMAGASYALCRGKWGAVWVDQ